MKYGKISVTLSQETWRAVICAIAVGIASDESLIEDLHKNYYAQSDKGYLIQCYADEVKQLRNAKEEIWRRLTD